MSIVEMVNAPIDVSVAGKSYKMLRMPIRELFAPIQANIISEYKKNAREIAETLTGKEKFDWNLAALKNIPTKAELDQLCLSYLTCPTGMCELFMVGLSKCQPVNEQEISDLIFRAKPDELAYIHSYLTGEDFEVCKKKLTLMMAEAEVPEAKV
jgi:hypothetical protein